jgi:hypothetical protein
MARPLTLEVFHAPTRRIVYRRTSWDMAELIAIGNDMISDVDQIYFHLVLYEDGEALGNHVSRDAMNNPRRKRA